MVMSDDSKDSIMKQINDALPPTIKVFDMQRVTQGFNARKFCSSRHYEYLLPTVALSNIKLDLPLAKKPKRALTQEEKEALLKKLQAQQDGDSQEGMDGGDAADEVDPKQAKAKMEEEYAKQVGLLQQDPFANGSAFAKGRSEAQELRSQSTASSSSSSAGIDSSSGVWAWLLS